MMAAGEFSRVSSRGTRSRVLAGTVVLAVASAAGVAVANSFLLALAGLAAVVVLVLLLCRLDLVVALLAADFFFNSYLSHGAGIITIDKVIGALAVAAWLLDWVVNRRSILGNRQLLVLGAFLAWTAVSIAGAVSDKAALVTSLRYLIFATLYFLVIQMVRGERRRGRRPPPGRPRRLHCGQHRRTGRFLHPSRRTRQWAAQGSQRFRVPPRQQRAAGDLSSTVGSHQVGQGRLRCRCRR